MHYPACIGQPFRCIRSVSPITSPSRYSKSPHQPIRHNPGTCLSQGVSQSCHDCRSQTHCLPCTCRSVRVCAASDGCSCVRECGERGGDRSWIGRGFSVGVFARPGGRYGAVWHGGLRIAGRCVQCCMRRALSVRAIPGRHASDRHGPGNFSLQFLPFADRAPGPRGAELDHRVCASGRVCRSAARHLALLFSTVTVAA
jgi:hypothetical protein